MRLKLITNGGHYYNPILKQMKPYSKKYIILFSHFLLAIFFISCEKGLKIGSKKFNKILSVDRTSEIKLSNDIHYKSWQIHVKEIANTTIIQRKNYFTNSIIEYNLDTEKIHNTYTFKSEGPNRVSKFDAAAFIEIRDSLFLIAQGNSTIYLVQNDSVIFKQYFDDTGQGFGNIMQGFNKRLPIKFNDNIYISRTPSVARVDNFFYNENLLVKFNLKNKSLVECTVKYPKKYIKGKCWTWQYLRPSFTFNNLNQIIFVFPIDPNIYVYDTEKDKFVQSIKFSSIYPSKRYPMPCQNISQKEYEYNARRSSRYEAITYDKYRDLYYIFALHPPKELRKANAKKTSMRISIMTLDSNFKLISEDLLPDNIYDYEDFFITKEGLWLSRNNPLDIDFDENLSRFDLLTLKEKK
tara:strand:+ start:2089 stop:3315 length:1227 start_codon:yes stop_codon:yes gene_type:complete